MSRLHLNPQRCAALLLALTSAFNAPLIAQSYFLNGTAQEAGTDCYQLTTTQGNQNGAVWSADFIDLSQPFDLNLTMNFGDLDIGGADGMVFVLQDVGTSALGQTGGGLGFNGFDPSFGIEFDTWQNGQYGDLVQDHIGFISDGSVDHAPPSGLGGPVTANIDGANIEDGEDHPVRITWDPNAQIIAVYFDCEMRLFNEIDLIGDVFSGQELVYWGFTGSTGGSYNNQSVCLSPTILATGPETMVCPGGSVELNVVGAPGTDYAWEPSTFLSDSVGANVWCTPDTSITYFVTYDGFCENDIQDSIVVEVAELVASAEASPGLTLNCLIPSIGLYGGSNFSDGIDYQWISANGGNIPSNLGPNATVDAPGNYWLVVTSDDEVCTDTLEVEIIGDFRTYESTVTASSNQLNCLYDSVLLTLETAPVSLLEWIVPSNASFNWIDEPFELWTETSGVWQIVTTHPESGCETSVSLEIGSDFTPPEVHAGFADTLTCSVPTSTVSGVEVSPQGYTPILEWSWTEGALNSFAPWSTEEPQVLLPGTYYLNVTFEENGCTGLDSLVVVQDPEATIDASSAQFPNVITPNKDGKNERLTLYLAENPDFPLLSIVDQYELLIFNRWGEAIFSSFGAPVEWDGRINNKPVTEGTYYYRVRYVIICGEEQRGERIGSFEIFR